jgi:hypothetical protein
VAIVLVAVLLAVLAAGVMLRSSSATRPEGRTVAAYFGNPPTWPGPAWQHGNRTASWPELDASAGPGHCGWETLTFFTLGWPLGNASPTAPSRQYVRDPLGRLTGAHLLGTWAHNPTLPADTANTGYHYGPIKLYLAASDDDRYVYLVAPDDSERWPRSDPAALCL